MPKSFTRPADHEDQCGRNWDFYDSIGGRNASHSDWALTVAFYAAVHRVQAYLLSKMRQPSTHQQREDALREMSMDEAADTLQELREASRRTRYDCETVRPERLDYYESLAKVKLPELLK